MIMCFNFLFVVKRCDISRAFSDADFIIEIALEGLQI